MSEKVELTVNDMTCSHCVGTVRKALESWPLLCETPLEDTFEAQPLTGIDRPTFNNYQSPPLRGHRIDWILVSPEVTVERSEVNTSDFDGLYASDHLPVEATVRMARPLQSVGAAAGSRRGSSSQGSAHAP